MSKYYTPEIEEFHVGFEFEKLDPISKKWKEKIVKHGVDMRYKEMDIKNLSVRVKHLDKGDIESLGFFNTESSSKDYFEKSNHCIIMKGFRKNLGRRVTIGFAGISLDSEEFDGYVKNKSELIKLLKQLKIK